MDADALTRLRAQRFAFLRGIHEAVDGDRMKRVRFQDVGSELPLDEAQALKIADYLIGEGLVEWAAMGGWVKISHQGIKEFEEAVSVPEAPTEHFPALVVAENFLQIQSMVGSEIQQGTQSSSQVIDAGLDIESLRRLVGEIRDIAGRLQLEDTDLAEVRADSATLEAQLASPNPKRGVVSESAASMQRILEGAMGAGLAQAVPELPELLQRLAQLVGAAT